MLMFCKMYVPFWCLSKNINFYILFAFESLQLILAAFSDCLAGFFAFQDDSYRNELIFYLKDFFVCVFFFAADFK